MKEEGFRKVVEDGWDSVQRVENIAAKVKGVATSLQDWSKNVLGDLEKRLKKGKEGAGEVEMCTLE